MCPCQCTSLSLHVPPCAATPALCPMREPTPWVTPDIQGGKKGEGVRKAPNHLDKLQLCLFRMGGPPLREPSRQQRDQRPPSSLARGAGGSCFGQHRDITGGAEGAMQGAARGAWDSTHPAPREQWSHPPQRWQWKCSHPHQHPHTPASLPASLHPCQHPHSPASTPTSLLTYPCRQATPGGPRQNHIY